jgi:hypothetical protein
MCECRLQSVCRCVVHVRVQIAVNVPSCGDVHVRGIQIDAPVCGTRVQVVQSDTCNRAQQRVLPRMLETSIASRKHAVQSESKRKAADLERGSAHAAGM